MFILYMYKPCLYHVYFICVQTRSVPCVYYTCTNQVLIMCILYIYKPCLYHVYIIYVQTMSVPCIYYIIRVQTMSVPCVYYIIRVQTMSVPCVYYTCTHQVCTMCISYVYKPCLYHVYIIRVQTMSVPCVYYIIRVQNMSVPCVYYTCTHQVCTMCISYMNKPGLYHVYIIHVQTMSVPCVYYTCTDHVCTMCILDMHKPGVYKYILCVPCLCQYMWSMYKWFCLVDWYCFMSGDNYNLAVRPVLCEPVHLWSCPVVTLPTPNTLPHRHNALNNVMKWWWQIFTRHYHTIITQWIMSWNDDDIVLQDIIPPS